MIDKIYEIFDIDVDKIRYDKESKKNKSNNSFSFPNEDLVSPELLILKKKLSKIENSIKELSNFKNLNNQQQLIMFKLVLSYNKLLSEYNSKLEEILGITKKRP